jgi:hypothetical protein
MSDKTTHESYSEASERGHDRLLHTNFPAGWRSQRSRRIQVLFAGAALALYTGAGLLGFPAASAVGLVVFLALTVVLRLTTRGLADLPGSVLDERQLSVRNLVYVNAYRVTGGLIAVLATVCIGLTFLSRTQISTEASLQALLAALFIAIVTPSCLLAWTEREV